MSGIIEPIGGSLYQWDTGRRIRLETAPDWVDYTAPGLPGCFRVPAEENEAAVPNAVLTRSGQLTVWLVQCHEDGSRTVRTEALFIEPRPKPADYIYTDDEYTAWKQLHDDLTALEAHIGTVPSPDGSRWQLSAENDGTLVTEKDGIRTRFATEEACQQQRQDIADIMIRQAEYSQYSAGDLPDGGEYIEDATIRESSASYPGRISAKSTSRVHWFKVLADANMYFEVSATNTWRFRVSNEKPVVGNLQPFTGEQWDTYNGKTIPTMDNPYVVSAGQYIAFSKTTQKEPPDIKVYLQDVTAADLNPELPTIASLTASVNSEASAISALDNANIFPYCYDKVICIGDSLTAGSCYRSDGTHIGNIDQNYPYQLGRMMNTGVINAGHSGRTVKSWYTAHMGDTPDRDYAGANAVIIFLGTNNAGADLMTDTVYDDAPDGVSYTEYADTQTGYYCRLIAHILSINPYLRITLVNIFGSADGMDTNRKVIRKIAARYGLQCIETYDEFATAKHPEYHGWHGNVHLNKAGYLALAHHIYKALAQWIPEDLTRANFGVTVNGTPMRS